jgi:hypothetical protein
MSFFFDLGSTPISPLHALRERHHDSKTSSLICVRCLSSLIWVPHLFLPFTPFVSATTILRRNAHCYMDLYTGHTCNALRL